MHDKILELAASLAGAEDGEQPLLEELCRAAAAEWTARLPGSRRNLVEARLSAPPLFQPLPVSPPDGRTLPPFLPGMSRLKSEAVRSPLPRSKTPRNGLWPPLCRQRTSF